MEEKVIKYSVPTDRTKVSYSNWGIGMTLDVGHKRFFDNGVRIDPPNRHVSGVDNILCDYCGSYWDGDNWNLMKRAFDQAIGSTGNNNKAYAHTTVVVADKDINQANVTPMKVEAVMKRCMKNVAKHI